MVFSSPIFVFLFLPILIPIYVLCPFRMKNTLLLVFSIWFYAWGEPLFIFVILLSIVVNYFLAQGMSSFGRARKICLLAAGAFNLGILGYFKYSAFFWGLFSPFFGNNPMTPSFPVLPIGISFYTFQVFSYGVDIYRREAKPQKNILDLALYLLLFPQLIAGPIVRYIDIAKQLASRTVSSEDFHIGIRRFAVGFVKKMFIANTLANIADPIFALPPETLATVLARQGIMAYTLQIYYDFSGYSDMALGLGRLFGFRFKENFNNPYSAVSMRDFWRRWHLSLSEWFRDYVYIPLGGSRRGETRTLLNLFIVFSLCGLWHGAKLTFVVCGLYHGFFLLLEQSYSLPRFSSENFRRILGNLYTMAIVMGGLVIFRADSFSHVFYYMNALAGYGQSADIMKHLYFGIEQWVIFAIGLAGCYRGLFNVRGRWFEELALGATFAYSITMMAAGTYNPFIYYQF